MNYYTTENSIIYKNDGLFDISATLNCGQIFRYTEKNGIFEIISNDKYCKVVYDDEYTKIYTDHILYFIHFFDLDSDYSAYRNDITSKINIYYRNTDSENFSFLHEAVEYGKGIKILNQNEFETIISFIISTNNNIPRIKKIIAKICKKYGKCIKDDIYAFPTVEELSKATVAGLMECGAGYRAKYIFDTTNYIKINYDKFLSLNILNTKEIKTHLLKYKGVGNKVADCILLFAFHKLDIFPVDVWIDKIYRKETNDIYSDRLYISDYYIKIFGLYSGLLQQYIYYYKRFLDGANNHSLIF